MLLLAIFRRMQDPTVLVHLPDVIDSLQDAVVTDVSPQQIANAVCLLTRLTMNDLHFFMPPGETLRDGKAYIPSLKREMQIFEWDDAFVDWMPDSLAGGMK